MPHPRSWPVTLALLLAAPAAAAQSLPATIPNAPGTCSDGVRTGLESGVDCGGPCDPCAVGDTCRFARDCVSGRCGAGRCEERPYATDDPVPNGYDVMRSETDAFATVRTTGWVFFLASYAPAYVGAMSLPSQLGALYVPVVGPWFAIGHVDQSTSKVLIAVDGALQDAGAVLLIGGLLGAGQQLVRTPAPIASLHVVPHVGRDGYGLGVLGAF
jgi:hypothetical protein